MASLTSSETAFEVEQAQDKTLEDVEAMDDMRMSIKNPSVRKASAPALLSSGSHMLHTAKGERRFRDKVEREGIDNLPEEEQGKLKIECIKRPCNFIVYQLPQVGSFVYKHFLLFQQPLLKHWTKILALLKNGLWKQKGELLGEKHA